MGVATYFEIFCNDLLIGTQTRSDISTRYLSICTRLNKDFWDMDTDHGGRYTGSYGRNTANNWVSDIDMIFEMPSWAYNSYNNYAGNGQSALLQAVKNSISVTYPNTSVKGDGQIVQVKFSDGMQIEVLPGFKQSDGSYVYANSADGGSWKTTNPVPEIEMISSGDKDTNSNLRPLCRMMRAWKYYCSVPIKGILIDTLAYRFLTNWAYKDRSYLYYDWMTRDFFECLKNQSKDQTIWYAIGSGQAIVNSDDFRYKATIAFNKSKEAIQLLSEDKKTSAKEKWSEIYGARFPTAND
jgi:hypothetical protein